MHQELSVSEYEHWDDLLKRKFRKKQDKKINTPGGCGSPNCRNKHNNSYVPGQYLIDLYDHTAAEEAGAHEVKIACLGIIIFVCVFVVVTIIVKLYGGV